MPDTIVTIKLSVKQTNIMLGVLREIQQLNADVGSQKPDPGQDGMKAKLASQRKAVELQDIIEIIEGR